MPNPAGHNGHRTGIRPPDAVLSAVLHEFARRNMKNKERVMELSLQHGYNISTRQLMRHNLEFNVPSKRKLPPGPVVVSCIMHKVDQDTAMRNGPKAIADQLRTDPFAVPFLIGRDRVRKVMWENKPEGRALRHPGYRKPAIPRGVIDTTALLMETHFDGHEKLSFAALNLGDGIGIPIYGGREQLSGAVGVLEAVPNDRDGVIVAHCFLDHIELSGNLMSVQATMDKGTEVGWIIRLQEELRERMMPDVDPQTFPATVNMTSTRNVMIEGLWHWLLKTCGINLKEYLLNGRRDGIFIPGNELHRNLFRWLWPKIVQRALDQFRQYWNLHQTRRQPGKPNPSGRTPDYIWRYHAELGYPSVGVYVPPEVMQEMRALLPLTREEAYRWVEDDFAHNAELAYDTIGRPELIPSHGWDIFVDMLGILDDYY
ncbi:hypothetical protein GGG16DRAFT_119559 [Schizophyllum commune]